MLRRASALLAMLLLVPGLASAYNCWYTTFSTSPTSQVAAITPPEDENIAGVGYLTVGTRTNSTAPTSGTCGTAPASMSFDVAVPEGYKITAVKIDGVSQSNPAAGTYTVSKGTKVSHTFQVTYATAQYTITTTPSAGGSISPSSTVPSMADPFVAITPSAGFQIASVTVQAGNPLAPVAVTLADVIAAGGYQITDIDKNYAISATFVAAPTAAAVISTPSQTVALNATVLVDASNSTSNVAGATYGWSVTPAGASITPTAANAKTANFVATQAGTYTVKLIVTAAGTSNPEATVTFTVPSGYGDVSCVNCHTGSQQVTKYQASVHFTGENATCSQCHNPGGAVANHPYNRFSLATAAGACTSCHTGENAAHEGAYTNCIGCHDPHAATSDHMPLSPTSTALCGSCHSSASAHYGGTAFLKAQYVSDASLPVSCSSCHRNPTNATVYQSILTQYAASAHGDPAGEAWRHYDWRSSSRAACARCHTGTAFVAKLGNENDISNAYQPGDVLKPGEVLSCAACHIDAGTGDLRPASQSFTINMTSGTVTYNVTGASALCARCHGGRETGESIKDDPGTTGVRGFIDSHYLAAAGTLYNQGGYEYEGQTYNSLGAHKEIGLDNQGPCVACHMSGKNHTFVSGSNQLCASCHNDSAAMLAAANASFAAALDSLRLALEAKGIYYNPAHPYFFTDLYEVGEVNTAFTNWAGPYGAASWKDVMGAAFNYNLLVNEPGAYAHNRDYAMKLIADSIDFLSDGAVNGQ